jgi:glycerol-3-phosphate dehydrogenase (NAD(P)+)
MLNEDSFSKILVLGSGNFGTCLGDHLADLGHSVTLFARSKEVVDSINNNNINCKYMPSVELSANLKATQTLDEETVKQSAVILVSIPTQHSRAVLESIKEWLIPSHLLIFVNKGIEISTGLLPHVTSN